MPAKKSNDMYVNVLVTSGTMSAANTLTFTEINVGLNLFDKIGVKLSRIEFEMSTTDMAQMTATTDTVVMGLSSSNNITEINIQQAEVIDMATWFRFDGGAAATMAFPDLIKVHDFSTLPGGGLLVAPKPLYFAQTSSGLAAAMTSRVRLYFSMVSLKDSEYLELLETRRAFG